MKRLERVFDVYIANGSSLPDDHCGPGSTIDYTKSIGEHMVSFLKKHHITSILDCPCGTSNWMSQVELQGIEYIGADVVQSLVEYNKKTFPNKQFLYLDITEDKLPKSDLLFCRDCLFHFNYDDKILAFINFICSDIPYILTSNYLSCVQNLEIETGQFAEVNWGKEPFNFSDPIDNLDDSCGGWPPRVMSLYSKNQIYDALSKKGKI